MLQSRSHRYTYKEMTTCALNAPLLSRSPEIVVFAEKDDRGGS